ncbi:MAG: peptidylprolyl isomerase [Acidobacteriota bacterium]
MKNITLVLILAVLLVACSKSTEEKTEPAPAAPPPATAPTTPPPAESKPAAPEAGKPPAAEADKPVAAKTDKPAVATKPTAATANKKGVKMDQPAKPAVPTEEVAVLETTSGTIVVAFFPDIAPEHVKNFKEHIKAGRYIGTYFHRVIPGFMIQGGDFNTKDNDPTNDGMGGWSYKGEGTFLKAEFSSRPHKRGILSMARGGRPDSAGSQFFIMHADYPSLDGAYSVFGRVTSGMDTVDKIVHQDGTPGAGGGKSPFVKQLILKASLEQRPVAK